jgi:hypothetical protein
MVATVKIPVMMVADLVVEMASGIVVMVSVFLRAMFVMAQVNLAMLDGLLTVQMAQTRL